MSDLDVTIGNDVTMRGGSAASVGRIDQYELLRELGGGGFGCVYLAKDTVAGIEVAVKGLPPEVRHNKEELENIRANFALVSRLHHPNIAAALVLHPAKEVSYANRDAMEKLRVFERDTMMVMEYAPGVTLSQWRKQFPDKKVPLEKALDITRQVASALDYAHGEKIVHRDVKPSNVMIETKPDGAVVARVLDFGLAAEIRSSMGRVSREIRDTSGTRPYMAPEQWRGAKQGPATDQYALAAMFCELVTGEVPFASVFDTGDPVVMLTNVTTLPPELPDSLPKAVRFVLAKALAKQPEERFGSCVAFVDALGGADVGASAGKTWLVVALLVLLALAAVGGWWWHERVKSEELRVKNEALAAERARQAEELRQAEEAKRKAEETRLAAEKAEAERKAKVEAERFAEEKAEAERKARLEAERVAEENRKAAARLAEKKFEAERKAKLEAERIAEEKRRAEEAERNRKSERERAIRDGRELKIGSTTCKMVYCEGKDGVPSFWISQREISRGMWDDVMQTRILPKREEGAAVVNVSWDDCRAFVERVNGRSEVRVRLPTAAEVESALRHGILTAEGSAWTADDFDIGASAGIKCAVDLGRGRRMGLLGSSRRGDLGLCLVAED